MTPFTKRVRQEARYRGWWVVAGGLLILALVSGPHTFGVGAFFVDVEREFHWSRTLLSGAFVLGRFEGATFGPLEGYLADRLGPQRVIMLGLLIAGAGFIYLAFVSNVVSFYLAFFAASTGMGLAGFIPVMSSVNQWFAARRASAMAVATLGLSVGGIMVSLLAWGISAHGWRMASIGIGVALPLLGLPLSRLLRPPTREQAPEPQPAARAESQESRGAPAGRGRDFTAREALRTRSFWLVTLAHSGSAFAGSAVFVHAIPQLTDVGLSLPVAGAMVTTYMVVELGARLLGGFTADRVDKRFVIFGFTLFQATSLVVLAFTRTIPVALLFALLFGIGHGGRSPPTHAIRGDYFGRKAYGTITGLSNLFISVVASVSPLALGAIFDLQGTYMYGLLGIAVVAVAGASGILMAEPTRVRRKV